jgi:hypothetical protein
LEPTGINVQQPLEPTGISVQQPLAAPGSEGADKVIKMLILQNSSLVTQVSALTAEVASLRKVIEDMHNARQNGKVHTAKEPTTTPTKTQ